MVEYITKEQAWNIARLAARTGSTIKALNLLDETPAADVAEVVRCKDCVHFDAAGTTHKGYCFCTCWEADSNG